MDGPFSQELLFANSVLNNNPIYPQYSTAGAPSAVHLAGYQTDYTYDRMGNRLTKNEGGNATGGSGMRTTNYTPNPLNQYASVGNPQAVDVTGNRAAGQTIAVSASPGTSSAVLYQADPCCPGLDAHNKAWDDLIRKLAELRNKERTPSTDAMEARAAAAAGKAVGAATGAAVAAGMITKGGCKTGRKLNRDAIEIGKAKVAEARKAVESLKSKQNKCKAHHEDLKKAERALNKAISDMKKSENHAQRGQR